MMLTLRMQTKTDYGEYNTIGYRNFKPGKNTVDSDFILKILDDFKQKPIDTFVREGLQNCLDARIDGTPKVCVDINVIEGESKTFISLLGNKPKKIPSGKKLIKLKPATKC